MKKILFIIILQAVAYTGFGQQTPAKEVASKIADNLHQVLELSKEKRDSIYSINLWLHERKTEMRQQFTNPDSIRIHVNRIERLRDSLYRPVLGTDKFPLYKNQKAALITIN